MGKQKKNELDLKDFEYLLDIPKDVITKYYVEQNTDEWFELRQGRITASKFKDLMSGVSTNGYKNIINRSVIDILGVKDDKDNFSNFAMKRGNELEPFAVEFYEKNFNIKTSKVGFITNEAIFGEYVGVSPDREVLENNSIIEIKCPFANTQIEYLSKNVLPNEYKWQVQGQLLVTQADYCDFFTYHPDLPYFHIRVYPNLKMFAELYLKMEITISEIKNRVNNLVI